VAGALTVVVAVGVITWASVSSNDATKSSATDPRLGQVSVEGVATVGDQAPDFTLKTLDGKTVSLSDYRGKPVVINFWQSYCIPCRAEFPMLRQQVGRNHGDFVLLGIDYDDIPSDARAFAEAQHAAWPILDDSGKALGQAYGIRAIPQTFFVNRDGTISQRYYGRMEASEFAPELAKIVKPSAPATTTSN
jgi:peroxiredoxin